MERRVVIKQVLIMAAGIALLPSCLKDQGKASIALNTIDISADQELLLAQIAETIIPTTDTPGAISLKLHLFVLKMLDDCYPADAQQDFIKGLKELSQLSTALYNRQYAQLPVKQRESILADIEQKRQQSPAITAFYKIMKEEIIKGYLNSQYVMSKLIIYELVPGRYNGYYPVKTA